MAFCRAPVRPPSPSSNGGLEPHPVTRRASSLQSHDNQHPFLQGAGRSEKIRIGIVVKTDEDYET